MDRLVQWSVAYGGQSSDVVIPNGAIGIREGAFRNIALTSIAFPEGVREIGKYAFQGCEHLVSVTLPESFEKIGNGAFKGLVSKTCTHCGKPKDY